MKKIFAVSFLSVLAVGTTTNAWANAGPNLNLATAEYVKSVENRFANYVGNSGVVDSQGQSWDGNDYSKRVENYPDSYVPTIARVDAAIEEAVDDKVDKAQAVANAIMITNAAGNVIPAPVGDCANTTNKCALVTGVDESGNLVLQWEVIARNVVQPTE